MGAKKPALQIVPLSQIIKLCFYSFLFFFFPLPSSALRTADEEKRHSPSFAPLCRRWAPDLEQQRLQQQQQWAYAFDTKWFRSGWLLSSTSTSSCSSFISSSLSTSSSVHGAPYTLRLRRYSIVSFKFTYSLSLSWCIRSLLDGGTFNSESPLRKP